MRKLMTEETKAVSGGVYDKDCGVLWSSAKCGCCGRKFEGFGPWGIGMQSAIDKAYECELSCIEIFIANGWEPKGELGR